MRKMNIFLVLLSVVGLSLAALDIPEHMEAPFKQMRKVCLEESGVEEKYVDESKNGYLSNAPGMPCYVKCLLNHLGVMDDSGDIDFSKIFHLLTPNVKGSLQDAIRDCGTQVGDNNCEKAYNTIKCFFTAYPEGAELA